MGTLVEKIGLLEMHPHFMNFNMFTWQTRICVIKGGYLWKYDQYVCLWYSQRSLWTRRRPWKGMRWLFGRLSWRVMKFIYRSPISLESCTIKHYQKKNYFYLEVSVLSLALLGSWLWPQKHGFFDMILKKLWIHGCVLLMSMMWRTRFHPNPLDPRP